MPETLDSLYAESGINAQVQAALRQPVKELDDSYEFKPALIEIEDSPVSPLGRTTLWLLLAIITFFVGWTCLGDIDVVVSAHGHLIPDGHVKILQPLDTGVVRQILVKEGDFVRKGQILMQIDPSTTAPEMFSLDSNLQYANLEKSRIAAVMQGALMDLVARAILT